MTLATGARAQPHAWWLCLLALGLGAAGWKLRLALASPWIGHADAAAYAEMADSLLAGRGFEVDYVSTFFLRHDRVSHPESHWPPLQALLIAPCFLLFGKVAWAAKVPSIAISSLLLPLATGLLARRLGAGRAAALAAGVAVLVHPDFAAHSLRALADVTFAFTVCLSVLLAVLSLERPRALPALGAALAAAYYAKGAGLALFPAAVGFHLLTRARQPPGADRRFAAALAIAALLLLPWLARNALHFGNPLFSTQQYVAGFFGYLPWESAMYHLYWGEELPSLWTKLERWGVANVAAQSGAALLQNLWWVFADLHGETGELGPYWFYTGLTGAPAAAALALFAASRLGRRDGDAPVGAPWEHPGVHAVWLTGACLLVFLSLTWMPLYRLVLPLAPLAIALGWATIGRAAGAPLRAPRHRRLAETLAVAALLAWVAGGSLQVIREDARNPFHPYDGDRSAWIETGRWIGAELPGSVTLTRNPWELHFYSGELAVQIPAADLSGILAVARHYGATHLIPAPERPALAPWLAGRIPGLSLVRDAPLPVYGIDWDRLPPGLRAPEASR